ncbi:MAG: BF3164 family lipoprotein [Bacteroidales bacterium]
MVKVIYCAIVLVSVFSCRNVNVKPVITEDKSPVIAPLIAGEFCVDDADFGDVIELTGVSKPVDVIFKVSETRMVTNDTLLIVKNRHNNNSFMLFSLPDFHYIKSVGIVGNGPDEFLYPKLISGTNSGNKCLILNKNKVYSIDSSLNLKREMFTFPDTGSPFDTRDLSFLNDSSFLYVNSTPKGKEVSKISFSADSISISDIYNLSFLKGHKGWATYIGDFGINRERNRIVYAYKYFKRLVFTTLDGLESRVIYFNAPEIEKKDAINTLGPDNVTHYWGISAQQNYIYLLYSGRTPLEVGKDFKSGKNYIYVEQFDWNGNPVRKFKLDHWGYFCVNESETKLYLASVTDENPFYVYDLPPLVVSEKVLE